MTLQERPEATLPGGAPDGRDGRPMAWPWGPDGKDDEAYGLALSGAAPDDAVSIGRALASQRARHVAAGPETLGRRANRATRAGLPHRAAIWRTALDPGDYRRELGDRVIHDDWSSYLATLPTRMWPMGEPDRRRLVNWGYLASDLTERRLLPDFHSAEPPRSLPFPNYAFDQSPAA